MLDAVLNFAVRRFAQLMPVQIAQAIEQLTSAFGTDAWWITEVQHGIFGRTEQHSLMPSGQKNHCPTNAPPVVDRLCLW